MYYETVRFLVTGGAGYLGSHLVTQLIEQGYEVIVFDDYSGSLKSVHPSIVKQIHGSINSMIDLEKLDSLGNIDGVFHLAAKKSVKESEKNRELYWDVNVNGTKTLLRYCSDRKIPKVVFTSSAAVYGSLDLSRPILETDPTLPINVYGATKIEGENLVRRYCLENNSSAISLRLFNLSGADSPVLFDENGENVIPIILRCLEDRSVFEIFGSDLPTPDGSCLRDYVNVFDAAAAHLKAMEFLIKSEGNISLEMNIASGVGVSVKQLIKIISTISRREVFQAESSRREGDPISSIGDSSRAALLLNWKAERDINRIVRESLGMK